MATVETLQGFRLSPHQRRLWRLLADGVEDRARCAFLLEGRLDRGLLEAAVEAVFARHEILRTSFHRLPGMKVPIQRIEERSTPRLEFADLRGFAPDEQDAEIGSRLAAPGAGDSGARASLLSLAPERYLLVLELSALCADAGSFDVLLRDLSHAYGGTLAPPEADEILQYADFAEWQNDLIEGEDAPEGRSYWQGLADSAPGTLPLGERRPMGMSGIGSVAVAVDPDTARGLDRVAGELGASPGVLLAAAWQTMLWRLGGEPEEVLIGRVSDGRKYEDLQGAVGLFARCLPCRTPFEATLGFDQVVERADRAVGEGEAWQEYFAASEHGQAGQESEEVRFFAGFELEERPAAVAVRGVRFSIHRLRIRTEPFELALTCVREAGSLSFELRYDRGLYDDAAAARISDQLAVLLASVARNPRTPVAELQIVGVRDHALLRSVLEGTPSDLPAACIHERFEAQAERSPDRTALVAGGREVSYAELNRRANQLAHHLRRLGAGPEITVALAFKRSAGMVVGLLGALKAGSAYVPLDLESPKSRIDYVLRDARVAILVTEERRLAALPPFAGPVVCLDRDRERLDLENAGDPELLAHADNLAYVTYTSGSTGRPKGVLSTHRGAVNYLDFVTRQYGVGRLETVLQMAAFSFDASVRDIVGPLLTGARVLLVEGSAAKEPATLLAAIREHRVDGVLSLVPTMFRALAQAAREIDLPYDSVRLLLLSGEALRLSDVRQARRVFGERVEVVNQYGPTECTMTSSFWPVPADAGTASERGLVPIGRPIQNLRFRLLDRRLMPVPVGVPGELCIGGVGVTRGYLGLPDKTAERFVPDPEGGPGERLFRTGDLARCRPDGELELLGREDRQVKVRGVRVELDEVEALLSEHPDLREVAVVLAAEEGRDDRLVAYVVPGAQRPSAGELRAFLQERLPGSMIPALFIPLEGLPRTRTGKVDRGALPAPERARPTMTEARTLTSVESVLVPIWCQVLGLEEIGPDDNFFEMGGHSLLAAQLTARVQEAFSIDLPLRTLFEATTVALLAERIETAMRAGRGLRAPALERVPRGVPLPASFAQQRLWFLQQLDPDTCAFNVPRAVRLRGELGPGGVALLGRAMNEIVRRHEVLRTTFREVGGEPFQVIGPTVPVILPVVDLSGLRNPAAEADRLCAEAARMPFDLAAGPVLRVLLLRLVHDEHLLLLNIHHIATDHWSMGVLVGELMELYDAFLRGESSPLPELPVQYADFASWQRSWLQGEELKERLDYWRQRLSVLPPLLEIPFSRPRPAMPSYRGARHAFLLPPALSGALGELSRREGVTLFMTMVAAFKTLLHRYTGREDIAVGIDVANRGRIDVDSLIGFFVNILVLRTSLGTDPTFRELLRREREAALGAYTHQDLPFELLVQELQPDRNTRTPIFQYLMVLQNARRRRLELPGLELETVDLDNGTSKFDFVLILTETEEGIAGTCNYSTDLFDAQSVARLTRHLTTLLESIVARPEARLSELEFLSLTEREQEAMEKKQRKQADFAKFLNVKPKAIQLSRNAMVTMEPMTPDRKLPLLVQPAGEALSLADWARANRETLEGKLFEHGAVLFRGFGLETAEQFEEVARAFCSELFAEYGDLPRDAVSGKVYTSTPYPPDRTIWFHNESSQLDNWPLKQFFFCVQPAAAGGATPIADCRQVYELLPPDIRDRFDRLGVMYVRNYTPGLDVDWRDFFHTSDRVEVEDYCRRSAIDFEWKADGGLRTRKICPAVANHPRTGERVFFNQIQAHHIACLPPDDRRALLDLFAPEDLPRNAYYGDGTPIEDSLMQEIVETYQRIEVTFPWQKGDLLMVDNMLTAHGRYPYAGPRKILVAMSEMISIDAVWPAERRRSAAERG